MGIKSALVTYLLTKSGVTDLIGSGNDARIFPKLAPKNADLPYVVMNRISNVPDGTLSEGTNIYKARIQLDCYATNDPALEALEDALRNALDGLMQTTSGSVRICSVREENAEDDIEAPTDASEVGIQRTRMDFGVWYAVASPTL